MRHQDLPLPQGGVMPVAVDRIMIARDKKWLRPEALTETRQAGKDLQARCPVPLMPQLRRVAIEDDRAMSLNERSELLKLIHQTGTMTQVQIR